MCAPMYIKSEDVMYQGILEYAREYKKYEGKHAEEIEKEMKDFENTNEYIKGTAGTDYRCS